MNEQPIVFCDVETTTDDPLTGHVWEIGLIVRQPGEPDAEYSWLVDPGPLDGASRTALRITSFYERTSHLRPSYHVTGPDEPERLPAWDDPVAAARRIAALTDSAIFVANNPTFDGPYLDKFLREYGQIGTWDYRHRDLGSILDGWMAGYRAARNLAQTLLAGFEIQPAAQVLESLAMPEWPQPGLGSIARALGINPDQYQAHQALEDARLLRDCWDQLFAEGFRT